MGDRYSVPAVAFDNVTREVLDGYSRHQWDGDGVHEGWG